jgi:hypothetical protein
VQLVARWGQFVEVDEVDGRFPSGSCGEEDLHVGDGVGGDQLDDDSRVEGFVVPVDLDDLGAWEKSRIFMSPRSSGL